MNNDEDPIDSLMPEEQAVVDAEAKRVAEEVATPAASQAAADAEAAATAQAEAQRQALADQQAQSAAAAAAAITAAATRPVVPAVSVDPALASRNFEAERKALDEAWDAGDLSQSEWAAKFAEITEARITLVSQQQFAQMRAQETQAQAAQTFEAASAAFLSRPENADLADPTRFAMFQDTMNRVDATTAYALDPASLLLRAQQEFRKVVQAPVAVPRGAAPVRSPDLSAIPPRLTGLPQAADADMRGSATVEQLSAMEIEDLEERFAGMGDDAIARILAQTPGADFELRPAAKSDA